MGQAKDELGSAEPWGAAAVVVAAAAAAAAFVVVVVVEQGPASTGWAVVGFWVADRVVEPD